MIAESDEKSRPTAGEISDLTYKNKIQLLHPGVVNSAVSFSRLLDYGTDPFGTFGRDEKTADASHRIGRSIPTPKPSSPPKAPRTGKDI